jgi:hypothetical protein
MENPDFGKKTESESNQVKPPLKAFKPVAKQLKSTDVPEEFIANKESWAPEVRELIETY